MDIQALADNYKAILTNSILADGLQVTPQGDVDLSHYNKPIKAPEFVTRTIQNDHFNINDAVENFVAEVKANPNHKCRHFTEKVIAEHGDQIYAENAAYFASGTFPEANLKSENSFYSALLDIMEWIGPEPKAASSAHSLPPINKDGRSIG